jgi:hypothetical protein
MRNVTCQITEVTVRVAPAAEGGEHHAGGMNGEGAYTHLPSACLGGGLGALELGPGNPVERAFPVRFVPTCD